LNGMIVDGLGHVSLDNSSVCGVQQAATNLSRANIHQGSIPATGRKDLRNTAAGSAGPTAAASMMPPVSAATSLQFNQLIGGGISPNLLLGQPGGQTGVHSVASFGGLPAPQVTAANLMIGDYVHGGNPSYVLGGPNPMRQ
jgi:hypothetical protein